MFFNESSAKQRWGVREGEEEREREEGRERDEEGREGEREATPFATNGRTGTALLQQRVLRPALIAHIGTLCRERERERERESKEKREREREREGERICK